MANKEELLTEAKEKGLAVPEGATKAEVQALLDDHAKEVETELGSSEEEAAAAREDETPALNQAANTDAQRTAGTNAGSEIAQAIVDGLKASKSDNFTLRAEEDVQPRFTLVKNKQTGEVMIRENETGTLSKVQLKSLEEKEADVQATEVEEL